MTSIVLVSLLLLLAVIAVVMLAKPLDTRERPDRSDWLFTPEHERAGLRGEEIARRILKSVLRDDDRMFTNVRIKYEDKPAELDLVVVNRYGVFVFEVKNYRGRLVGGEDDFQWQKYKTTEAGNTYEKAVKNPIRQVRREVYVLHHYLDRCG